MIKKILFWTIAIFITGVVIPYLVFGSETYRTVTAYNVGDESQTDDTPCIDASNQNICEALDKGELRCAANFVPLGTYLEIDKVGICKVTDRTNRRYRNRVDLAFKKNELKKALVFGRQTLKVKILNN
jgi:3D (Asp-Asp-Asp) domain-containing protein